MKKTNVYMCSNGHLHYYEDPPKICKHKKCGSTEFGLISRDFELEDVNDTEESEYDNN